MSRKLKFLILVLTFVFLGWFVCQPLTRIGFPKPYFSPPAAGQKISAAELSEFLNLWSRMMQGPLKEYVGQISLAAGKTYPRPLVKWLDVQNWNPDRFFYDEQRLHELVACVKGQDSLNGNLDMDKRNLADLSQIIDEQRQRLKACHFDEDELELVRVNLYQITEIFAGRAVLAKPAE